MFNDNYFNGTDLLAFAKSALIDNILIMNCVIATYLDLIYIVSIAIGNIW